MRSRIHSLEERLGELERETKDVRAQRERLNFELELAQARVEELEIVLTNTRDEAVRIRDDADRTSEELTLRRAILMKHLEMLALLGKPGPLQLLYDAARGGDLEQSISTVTVLTTGQVRLMEEYAQMQSEQAGRLADLSRVMEVAQAEAKELLARRAVLEDVSARVEAGLKRLERSRTVTKGRLDEMREREQALKRLMGIVAKKQRMTGNEDIRRYRGALPWPVAGEIAQTFGRHYMQEYSAYRVCNGLRLKATSGSEVKSVFAGAVAYAQHFKGYGNMVIVDHGHGIYSLAAGLATIHVRRDQRVMMGTRLGLASPARDEGNVYFEVRVENRPQDPRRWLQLNGG
ncbi:MAG: peptidoglycan DD-metalloendopeptidase family protein [bacterium]|nr:peptidoglycan DD-metalloendopeptidase family protein [bacterium]